MTALDAGDLVVIAGRTLGIGTHAALAQMDIAAAQDALDEARPSGEEPGMDFPDRAAAAAAGVGLVRALLRHRPFPAHGQQVAVAAGLQFLSLNGWRADLSPAPAAAVVVEALASGRLSSDDAAAWLSARLSPVRRARQAPFPAVRVPVRVPVRRAVAAALLVVAVTGAALASAACSRGADMPAPSRGGSVVHQSSP